MDLTLLDFEKLNDIFKSNHWNVESTFEIRKKEDYNIIDRNVNIYNSIMDMLRTMNQDEKQVTFQLLEKYKIISFASYIPLLEKLLNQYCQEEQINHQQSIYCCVVPKNHKTSRSSQWIINLIEANVLKLNFDVRLIPVPIKRIYLHMNKNLCSGKTIIIDDFIGTGETIVDGFRRYTPAIHLHKADIMVLSFIGMQKGLDYIQRQFGIRTLSLQIKNKAISENNNLTNEQKKESLSIISNIEHRILKSKDYESFHLGYSQSEAAVSMLTTPDNTFPLFWYNNLEFTPPFLREV